MSSPQELRKIRLKADYKEMCNIRGKVVQWKAVRGEPPYVEEYELFIKVRTIINNKPEYRDEQHVTVNLPESYPIDAPQVRMKYMDRPFHVNWYKDGSWCYGLWNFSEGLGHHIIRMIRTFQFDPEITNEASHTCNDAKKFYTNKSNKGLFPCDKTQLPDPSKSRFEVQSVSQKTFRIN